MAGLKIFERGFGGEPSAESSPPSNMREARLYSARDDGTVDCFLCSFHCHISDGKSGVCGVRENVGGTLFTHVYGRLIAEHIDPIEKKPLYHFQPSSSSYSIAT